MHDLACIQVSFVNWTQTMVSREKGTSTEDLPLSGVGEMSWWLALAALPEGPGFIPRIHMVAHYHP